MHEHPPIFTGDRAQSVMTDTRTITVTFL